MKLKHSLSFQESVQLLPQVPEAPYGLQNTVTSANILALGAPEMTFNQYIGSYSDNMLAINEFLDEAGIIEKCRWVGNSLVISTLEGEMTASPGDYIIKGIKGEVYPCKPDIFEQTYEVL